MSRFKEYSTKAEKEAVENQLADISKKMHEQLNIIHKGPDGSESVRAARIEYDRLNQQMANIYESYQNIVMQRFLDENKNNPNNILDKILRNAMLTAYTAKVQQSKVTPDTPPGIKLLFEEGIKPEVMRETIQENNVILIEYLQENFPQTHKEMQEAIFDITEHPENVEDYINAMMDKRFPIRTEITPIMPKIHKSPNDSISNKLWCGDIIDAQKKYEIDMTPNSDKLPKERHLSAYVQIKYDELDKREVFISQKLTSFDRQVQDAIISLVLAGNNYMYPLLINRVIEGNQKARMKDKRKADIIESMTRLNSIRLRIITGNYDIPEKIYPGIKTPEITKYKKLESKYEGHLVDFKSVENTILTAKGKEIAKFWYVPYTPLLYDYANAKNQIIERRVEMRNITDTGKSDTCISQHTKTINLNDYITRRIEVMKHNKKQTRIIKYETIYKVIGITDNSNSSKVKKSRERTKVEKILKNLVEKKSITDYKINMNKRSYESVSIII